MIPLTMRIVEKKDLETLLNWRNSLRIRSASINDRTINKSEHLNWFQRVMSEELVVLIFELESKPIGVVNFSRVDWNNGTCVWGFYLGFDDLPKGTGKQMCKLALKYLFENMEIRKLTAEVLASNAVSVGLHEKLGFRREGLLKEHIKRDEIFEDIIIYSLFRNDYLEN